ncbi:Transposon TX1 protein [Smittium culicis]|uniref:Transposon TX1 protein n=1 Tax=Smittium culicis TaxID=133412 RepID=A0A1R1XVH3_9FUNG|nr:Transposon TX1 protein [Smittium culicis]
MEVWKTHFKNLTEDHSGNSKSSEKWKSVIDNDVDIFPECEECISWGEILTAIKKIPNKKASVIDGIPNEVYKLICDEKIPEPKFSKFLFRILENMCEKGEIPKNMKTSIVVLIPKKGDLKDTINFRGISLIPTLIKIFAKILDNKLEKVSRKYSIIKTE